MEVKEVKAGSDELKIKAKALETLAAASREFILIALIDNKPTQVFSYIEPSKITTALGSLGEITTALANDLHKKIKPVEDNNGYTK